MEPNTNTKTVEELSSEHKHLLAVLREQAAIMPRKGGEGSYRTWNEDFKRHVIEFMAISGLSKHAMAKQIDITGSLLHAWLENYGTPDMKSKPSKPTSKPKSKPKSKPQNGALKRYALPGLAKLSRVATMSANMITPEQAAAFTALVPTSSGNPMHSVADICLQEVAKLGARIGTGYSDIEEEEDLNKQLKEDGIAIQRLVAMVQVALGVGSGSASA
jgi:transposase-like protein